MFRLWGKIYKDNDIVRDIVVINEDPTVSRNDKITKLLEELCYELDLSIPLWLSNNKKEMPKYNKTSFYSDHFVDDIDFDYLEIEIIEEDE